MKKYVFFTFAISGIGGTQIYIRNKLLFLKKHGWDVLVVSTEPVGDICVKELLPFADYSVPELMKNPFILSKKRRKEIVDNIKGWIGSCEEVVIETNFTQVNVWGEMVAKECNAKHFAYLIVEDYRLSDLRYMKFFDFKYQRGELAGNTRYALPQLFEGYRTIPEDQTGELTAVCYNVIEECESEHDAYILDADYHIGSIGRVNKPFVEPMIADVCSFAKKHPDKTFQIVLFGGSPEQKDIEKIYALVENISNLSVYITGPIFPVPKHLLDQMDVFISSAGAARTSADAGYITITIDANDFEPIGILGYTTNDNVHRNPALPHESTEALLHRILINKEFSESAPTITLSTPDFMEMFKDHMAYLDRSSKDRQYYDMRKLRPKLVSILWNRLLHPSVKETLSPRKATRTVNLLTFHGSVNYGAALQAYALHKTVADMGLPCQVVDYNRKTQHRGYLAIHKASWKGIVYQLLRLPSRWRLHRKFNRFVKRRMMLTPSYDGYPALTKGCFGEEDIFIVGSDQIWNCDITEGNYHYYLDFTESKNKYSYAASLGVTNISHWTNKEQIQTLLQKFSKISVREESAAAVLEQEFGLSSQVVCDPTFLLTAEQWSAILPKLERKPYVLLFIFDSNETVLQAARDMAAKYHLELVNIAYAVKNVPGAKNVSGLSPEQWLAYIKNAAFVFTDSFHGFALSLNFNKQVWVAINNAKRGCRILDVANRYGCSHRIIGDAFVEAQIDYDVVNRRMDKDRQHSLSFLQGILNEANNK